MQKPMDSLVNVAPPGAAWSGGPIDLSKMALRVMSKVKFSVLSSEEKQQISKLLNTDHAGGVHHHWSLHSPNAADNDLDKQIAWIFDQLTDDLAVWQELSDQYRLDLFVGLFLERTNGGAGLSPESMSLLSARGVPIGFDIYTPTSCSEAPPLPEVDFDDEAEEEEVALIIEPDKR